MPRPFPNFRRGRRLNRIPARQWQALGETVTQLDRGKPFTTVGALLEDYKIPELPGVDLVRLSFARFEDSLSPDGVILCVESSVFVQDDGSVRPGVDMIRVAMPWGLRPFSSRVIPRIGFVGYNYDPGVLDRREAVQNPGTASEVREFQVIVPAYVPNDSIVAARGVVPTPQLGVNLSNTIDLIDLNLDGRAWAAE